MLRCDNDLVRAAHVIHHALTQHGLAVKDVKERWVRMRANPSWVTDENIRETAWKDQGCVPYVLKPNTSRHFSKIQEKLLGDVFPRNSPFQCA